MCDNESNEDEQLRGCDGALKKLAIFRVDGKKLTVKVPVTFSDRSRIRTQALPGDKQSRYH